MTTSRIRSRIDALTHAAHRGHQAGTEIVFLEQVEGRYYLPVEDPAHPDRCIDPAIDTPLTPAEFEALEAAGGHLIILTDEPGAVLVEPLPSEAQL